MFGNGSVDPIPESTFFAGPEADYVVTGLILFGVFVVLLLIVVGLWGAYSEKRGIPFGAVITAFVLTLPFLIFKLAAVQSAFESVRQRIWLIVGLYPTWAIIFGAFIALALYELRKRRRVLYGLIEIIFGMIGLWVFSRSDTLTMASPDDFTKWIAGFAAPIYVIVRGRDNIDTALALRSMSDYIPTPENYKYTVPHYIGEEGFKTEDYDYR